MPATTAEISPYNAYKIEAPRFFFSVLLVRTFIFLHLCFSRFLLDFYKVYNTQPYPGK